MERTALILVGPALGTQDFDESCLYAGDYDRRFRPVGTETALSGGRRMTLPPGLMISAPASGTGKTTLMLGLLRALAKRGVTVQPFKSGPDYIDPAFHRAASGRFSYNLDTWAMDRQRMAGLVGAAEGAELVLAEGSMGLFDGVAHSRRNRQRGQRRSFGADRLAGGAGPGCFGSGAVGGGGGAWLLAGCGRM